MIRASDVFRSLAKGQPLTRGNLETIKDRAALFHALADPQVRSELMLYEQNFADVDIEVHGGELSWRFSFEPPEGVNPLYDKERKIIALQREQFRKNKERT